MGLSGIDESLFASYRDTAQAYQQTVLYTVLAEIRLLPTAYFYSVPESCGVRHVDQS